MTAMTAWNITGQTYLVTDAGQEVGNALCKQLATLGANVIAFASFDEPLLELKKEFPNIKIKQVDLKDWQATKDQVQGLPPLDGLVNNSGGPMVKPFIDLTENDFDKTFEMNLKTVINATQSVLPRMKKDSSIVMVSSLASTRSFMDHAIYSASKAALDSLTRSLALELTSRKIRVNSVNPSVVLNEITKAKTGDSKKSVPLLQRVPLRRFCEFNELIDAIIFLLSNQSSYINGHHLLVEGGYSVS